MKEGKTKILINYEHEMRVNPYPGMLVSLEGLDGSGSSTQARNLEKYFLNTQDGPEMWLTKEPTEGPVGATIRHILSRNLQMDSKTLQMMFIVDRLDHLSEPRGIITRLKNKSLVVTDRYLWSTLAYGQVEDLDVNWLLAMQSHFPIPDLTFFLKTPVDVCLERIQRSRLGVDIFEKKEKLEKVDQGYDYLTQRFYDQFIIINGEKREADVYSEIISEIKKHPKFSSLSKANNTTTKYV